VRNIEPRHHRQNLLDVIPLPAPFSIFIDPSALCNAKCVFCPTNNSDYLREQRLQSMPFERFQKITEQLLTFKEQIKVICLYGFGEPLLNKNLPKMAKLLKENNLCREIRLVSNGILLNPRINKQLIESGIDLIRISLNGLNETDYKNICGVTINYGNFVDNIKNLFEQSRNSKTKISIKIATEILKNEKDKTFVTETFASICDFLLIEDIEEMWPGYNILLQNKKIGDRKFTIENNNKNETGKVCAYPLTHLVVFSNGNVGVCCLDWKQNVNLGNVEQETLLNIWNGEKMRNFRIETLKSKDRPLPCFGCKVRSPDNIDDVADELVRKL